MTQPIRNVAGIDDAPFDRVADSHTELVAAIYCDHRLDGLLRAPIRVDGRDATEVVISLIRQSRFDAHVRAVLVQGVTFGGFNVLDLARLARELQRPAIAVCRQMPEREAIRSALLTHFPDGAQRWSMIENLPQPVAIDGCHAQWLGCEEATARATVRHHCRHGDWPEPIRVAHLIATGLGRSAR